MSPSAAGTANPIRRLNPSGEDVLVRNALSGDTRVAGGGLFCLLAAAGMAAAQLSHALGHRPRV